MYERLKLKDEALAGKYLLYAVACGALALQGYAYMRMLPYGIPPDEVAHVSYAIHVAQHGQLVPDYKNRPTYNAQIEPGRNCWLVHPSFYYHLLRPFADADPAVTIGRLQVLRAVNLLLATVGWSLFLWLVCREDLPLAFHLYVVCAVISVPMIPYLAGSVNNDNLLPLAGALCVMGALKAWREPARAAGPILMGAGVGLGLLTKLTAAIQLGALAGLVVVARAVRARNLKGQVRALVWIAACVALPVVYHVAVFARYGTLLPSTGVSPGSAQWRDVARMPFTGYVRHFVWGLMHSWCGVLSHAHFFKRTWFERLPLLVPIGMAIAGLFMRGPRDERAREFFFVQKLALLATLVLFFAHFAKMYGVYRRYGFLGGIQARYYFALAPSVIMLSFRPFLGRTRNVLVLVILAVLICGFVASGLVYSVLRGAV